MVSPAVIAETAIKRVLEQYRNGYNQVDAAAVSRVFPSLNAAGLRRAFANIESQSMIFNRMVVNLGPDGTTASVSVEVQHEVRPKSGPRPDPTRVNSVFSLRKSGTTGLLPTASDSCPHPGGVPGPMRPPSPAAEVFRMLTAHGVSHPGRVRKSNEDRCDSDLALGIFVVADGMGGHNAGEVASALAVETIMTFMRRSQDGHDVTWPYGIDTKLSFHANRLMTAIRLANRRVFKTAESRDELSGMGTTVVAAFIDGAHLVFAGVGDSRIYSFLDGTLTQLTTDDSWVATLQASGSALPPGEKHPMRHVLTNVVGAREQVELQMFERTLVDGEVLMFCSDGLHGEITDEQVAAILTRETDVAAAADALVAAVLEQPAKDNVTALVVRYQA